MQICEYFISAFVYKIEEYIIVTFPGCDIVL